MESSLSAQRARVALAIALVCHLLMVWRLDFLCDDAFITFRYARNWADGHGLVYHPGITEPVEGYSEFLWAVVLGLGMKLGVAPELLSRVLSVGAGVALVTIVTRLLAARVARTQVATVAAGLFVGTAPVTAAWATGGMATMPAAALCTWLFARLHAPGVDPNAAAGDAPWRGRALGLGGIAAALALVRADGALLVALTLGPAILFGLATGRRHLWRIALGGATLSALAFLMHMAWRHSFYGDWVPNTARVKLGMTAAALGRGFDYLVSCLLSMPGLGVALVLLPLGAWAARRIGGGALALGFLVLPLGVAAYAVTSGGDFMCFARFLVPAVPFLGLGLGALLARAEARSRLLALGLGAVTVLLTAGAAFNVHPVPASVRERFDVRHNQRLSGVASARSELAQWRNMRDRAQEWGRLGRALRDHAPADASLVYGAVGAVGYFSNLFIYDANGLVTREVALREPHAALRSPGHDKNVPPEFFLKDRPTYLRAGVAPEAAIRALRQRLGPVGVLGPTERPGEVLWVLAP